MGQVTQAFPHVDLETVKQKVKLASSHWEKQKWLVIYNAIADPRTASEIALHVGVSKGFVRKVIQQYNPQGESGFSTSGKGGRRNSYLPVDIIFGAFLKMEISAMDFLTMTFTPR
ncbi:MAG: helix-turn-helix domain-containing protein [Spirirestis rafaelensis WJT71-NPBG6]|jgi:hypothetical protein|nr:helix-turn-helix domain-containing protein [Spirirestis rafaelensis WJT71-NPBG6]